MPYVVNHNPGADTLHREHGFEACNLDDAEDLEKVDDLTAAALVDSGAAIACEHCKPLAETDASEAEA
jgi:hypothetical protein